MFVWPFCIILQTPDSDSKSQSTGETSSNGEGRAVKKQKLGMYSFTMESLMKVSLNIEHPLSEGHFPGSLMLTVLYC